MFRAIWNTVAGVVVALVVIVGVNVYGDVLISAGTKDQVDAKDLVGASDGAAVKVASLGELLQTVTAKDGEKVSKKCVSCHTFKPGEPAKVGPNLADTVGADKAGHAGFAYSPALTGLGGKWTYQDLDHFLTKPSAFAPGTKMTFAGLRKAEDRAAIIAYLASLTASPPPFPDP